MSTMSEAMHPEFNIVTIGGGTGQAELLRGLRDEPVNVTAVVGMADDGGSTGRLRDEFGVPPPGDIRQCIAALSQLPDAARFGFNMRYTDGPFRGHAFGNLVLTRMTRLLGHDFGRAVRETSDMMEIQGSILPVTLANTRLQLRWGCGTTIVGESVICDTEFGNRRNPDISLTSTAELNPSVIDAIAEADAVVIAPGNLYCSLAPALVVPGMRDALASTDARVIMATNLVNKPKHTRGFDVVDYANEAQRLIGAPVLDYVLYNTKLPHADVVQRYVEAGEALVRTDASQFDGVGYEPIGLPLASDELGIPAAGDPNPEIRNFIRHDSRLLATSIVELLYSAQTEAVG